MTPTALHSSDDDLRNGAFVEPEDTDCFEEIPFDRWDWLMVLAAIGAVSASFWLLHAAVASIG